MSELPRTVKDILLKHLSRAFPDDALAILGVGGVTVEQALPTELPVLEVRSGLMDIVFALRDGTVLHLEFQVSREESLDRFLAYDVQLYIQGHHRIRTVIVYVAVDGPTEPERIDAGVFTYSPETIDLHQMDGDAILEIVEHHLALGRWEGADRIRLAFALHMRFQRMTRDAAFAHVLRLTQAIPEPAEQNYVTALIFGLSARQLTPDQIARLKEGLQMTEVLREFAEEAMQRGREEGRQEGLAQGRQTKALEVARHLLAMGMSVPRVAEATELSIAEIERLAR